MLSSDCSAVLASRACSLDIPWWEKLLGASFKGGKYQLKQLSGGKMDDITVLVTYVDGVVQVSCTSIAALFL